MGIYISGDVVNDVGGAPDGVQNQAEEMLSVRIEAWHYYDRAGVALDN
jgi:hypothetical protein